MPAEMEEPKRPQNAYWIWLGENREALAKEAGGGKASAVGKLAGERWKQMSAAKKAPFEKMASVKKEAYAKAMEEFKAQGGEAGKRRAEKASEKKDKLAKKARREARKTSGRPSKPQTAFWLYLSEHREALTKEAGSSKPPVVGKLAGEKWKLLSEKHKAPYENRAAELKANYAKAVEEWKKSGGGAGDAEAGSEQSDESGDEAASS